MPNPSTNEMEREVAKRPKTDQQHQPDQSLHAQEIEKLHQEDQSQQEARVEDAQSHFE